MKFVKICKHVLKFLIWDFCSSCSSTSFHSLLGPLWLSINPSQKRPASSKITILPFPFLQYLRGICSPTILSIFIHHRISALEGRKDLLVQSCYWLLRKHLSAYCALCPYQGNPLLSFTVSNSHLFPESKIEYTLDKSPCLQSLNPLLSYSFLVLCYHSCFGPHLFFHLSNLLWKLPGSSLPASGFSLPPLQNFITWAAIGCRHCWKCIHF